MSHWLRRRFGDVWGDQVRQQPLYKLLLPGTGAEGGGLEPSPKVSRTRIFTGDGTAGEGQLPLCSFLKMTGSQKGCGEGKSSFSFCGREAGREATSSPPALRLSSCESAEDRQAPSSPSLLPPCLPAGVPARPQLGTPASWK